MAERVKRWDYCNLTATYFVLLEKKLRGQSIRLTPANSPLLERTPAPKRNLVTDLNRGVDAAGVGTPLRDSPRGLHNSLEGGLDDIDLLKIGSPPPAAKDQVRWKPICECFDTEVHIYELSQSGTKYFSLSSIACSRVNSWLKLK